MPSWAGRALRSSAVLMRATNPVPNVDDAFEMPDGVYQLTGDGAALYLASDGDDARGHGHLEGGRVKREPPSDDLLHHVVTDLAI